MTAIVATTNEEAAERLWKVGLHRFSRHFPAWTLEAPDFAGSSLVFAMRNGEKQFRVRVENADNPGDGFTAGPTLRVRVVENQGAGNIADAFAEAILKIDRAGRALALPKAGKDASWRELFIANACNLRCTFCCESVRIGQGTLMPWEQIETVLRSYAADGVKVVQFMGGEPSIHPRFCDALRLSRELGMRNYAITNLLQWRKRDFAEEVGPLLDELMISMHALGEQSGSLVTGRKYWWKEFQEGVENAQQTLTGRVYGATVLSKNNVDDLEQIGAALAALGASKWVMGDSVPIAEAPQNSLEINLDPDDQRAQMGRFKVLHGWMAERGCEMVFFCMPDCVLSPDLWAASHDRMLHDQDLLGTATATAGDEVNFWSRTDYQEDAVRNVALGRRYADSCEGCTRKGTCGGYFDEHLTARGGGDLKAFLEEVPTPALDVPAVSAAVVFDRNLRRVPDNVRVERPVLKGRMLVAPFSIGGEVLGEIRLSPTACTSDRHEGAMDFRRRITEVSSRASDTSWPSFASRRPLLIMASGVPRSGTSWLTRITQNMVRSSGITRTSGNRAGQRMDDFPTNVEGDAEHLRLLEAIACFEDSGEGIHVLKTHYEVGPTSDSVRTLYIYRDPMDVLTSTFFYAQAGPAAVHFEGKSPEAILTELLDAVLPELLRSYQAALQAGPSTLLVQYRSLVEATETQILRIAQHIGLSLPPEFVGATARAHTFEAEAGRPAGDFDPTSYYRGGVPASWEATLPASLHGLLRSRMGAAQACFESLREK
ncbi:MAG: radical SAM protein [Rhodobacterales bacterium]|nr:radical SAM protein [Rhodobacterales bacterium]